MTYKDQLNRKLIVNETPRRIVSLVPSQTELLVDLGLEDSIVGITKFCIHPKYLRESKTLVGGTCLLYTSPSPRDLSTSRMPSSA